MPVSGFIMGKEEEPRLLTELLGVIRPPASGGSR